MQRLALKGKSIDIIVRDLGMWFMMALLTHSVGFTNWKDAKVKVGNT